MKQKTSTIKKAVKQCEIILTKEDIEILIESFNNLIENETEVSVVLKDEDGNDALLITSTTEEE